jgi:hypothetical protein
MQTHTLEKKPSKPTTAYMPSLKQENPKVYCLFLLIVSTFLPLLALSPSVPFLLSCVFSPTGAAPVPGPVPVPGPLSAPYESRPVLPGGIAEESDFPLWFPLLPHAARHKASPLIKSARLIHSVLLRFILNPFVFNYSAKWYLTSRELFRCGN